MRLNIVDLHKTPYLCSPKSIIAYIMTKITVLHYPQNYVHFINNIT